MSLERKSIPHTLGGVPVSSKYVARTQESTKLHHEKGGHVLSNSR
jgi:hypothetical protein